MNILEHVEKYLGTLETGWRDNLSEARVQILIFKNSLCKGCRTYCTLGISHHVFDISETKSMRLEFVYTVEESASIDLIASFLILVSEATINRHRAILKGETIPIYGEVAEKMGFDALYCTSPIYFEDSFAEYAEMNPPVIMIWLIPIYKSEDEFILKNGWQKFERILVEKDPHLWLMSREPVV